MKFPTCESRISQQRHFCAQNDARFREFRMQVHLIDLKEARRRRQCPRLCGPYLLCSCPASLQNPFCQSSVAVLLNETMACPEINSIFST